MEDEPSQIALVVAAATNDVIGYQGQLPWVLKDDMALFKRITHGHPVIMGRKTMDSLGKPLPGRTNLVISRGGKGLPGFEVVSSLELALVQAKKALGHELICIIGGGEIYSLAMPIADRIYLSRVETTPENGDAYFPTIPAGQWVLAESKAYGADARNQYPFTYQVWERR
jgi:dihydrofolate reductase